MNGAMIELRQPLAYRVWDARHRAYFYTDVQPDSGAMAERWTGLFDKEGVGLYENDIIRAHYDWRLGWVRACIEWDGERRAFRARGIGPDGLTLIIGFYSFADAYRVGNVRETPGKLIRATEQFKGRETEQWWLKPMTSRRMSSSQLN